MEVETKEVLVIDGERVRGLYLVCRDLIGIMGFAEAVTKEITTSGLHGEETLAIGIKAMTGAYSVAVARDEVRTGSAVVAMRKHKQTQIWALENELRRLIIKVYG